MDLAAELPRWIVADFAAINASLRAIAPPAGHRWETCSSALTWFAGDVLAATYHGASIFLRRDPPDDDDTHQLHLEVRLFWNANCPARTKAIFAARPRAMSAILWALIGKPVGFQARSLLSSPALFLKAENREALLRDLHSRIAAAIQLHDTAARALAVS